MSLLGWLASFTTNRVRTNARPNSRRFDVEPLEDRTNLSLPAAAPEVDFQTDPPAFVATDNHSGDNDRIQNQLTTTQDVVDGFRRLLYDYQQEIPALAELAPLDSYHLLHHAQAELDSAIDDISRNEEYRLDENDFEFDDTTTLRPRVRELQNVYDEIAETVAELATAESVHAWLQVRLDRTAEAI